MDVTGGLRKMVLNAIATMTMIEMNGENQRKQKRANKKKLMKIARIKSFQADCHKDNQILSTEYGDNFDWIGG